MKKTLIAFMAFFSMSAFAAGLTGVVKQDFDRLESTTPNLVGHRTTISLKQDFGVIGAVDGGVVAGQAVIGDGRRDATGFDVGYSNGLNLGPVRVGGRVGYVQLDARGGKVEAMTYAVTGAFAVTPKVSLVGGVEHFHATLTSAAINRGSFNRSTVGAEFALTKHVSIQATLARTHSKKYDANGFTTAVSYKF